MKFLCVIFRKHCIALIVACVKRIVFLFFNLAELKVLASLKTERTSCINLYRILLYTSIVFISKNSCWFED